MFGIGARRLGGPQQASEVSGINLRHVGAVRIYDLCDEPRKPGHLGAGSRAPARTRTAEPSAMVDDPSRLLLLHSFRFPSYASHIKFSPDGTFLAGSGGYPPTLRFWDLTELGLKHEHGLNQAVLQFQFLSRGPTHLAVLHTQRRLSFYVRFAHFERIILPRPGRDMTFAPETALLYLVTDQPELLALDLDAGQFVSVMGTLGTTSAGEPTCLGRAPAHGLLALGTDDGHVVCVDPRSSKCAGAVSVGSDLAGAVSPAGQSVTCVRFEPRRSWQLACGTASGHTLLYDLRLARPILGREPTDAQSPVTDLRFHGDSDCLLISASGHTIRILGTAGASSAATTAVETPARVQDLAVQPGSGLVLAALDRPALAAYYLPALGPAPGWAPHLEAAIEPFERDPGLRADLIADNHRFMSLPELGRCGLTDLVGTRYALPHMHGFLVHRRLVARALRQQAEHDVEAREGTHGPPQPAASDLRLADLERHGITADLEAFIRAQDKDLLQVPDRPVSPPSASSREGTTTDPYPLDPLPFSGPTMPSALWDLQPEGTTAAAGQEAPGAVPRTDRPAALRPLGATVARQLLAHHHQPPETAPSDSTRRAATPTSAARQVFVHPGGAREMSFKP